EFVAYGSLLRLPDAAVLPSGSVMVKPISAPLPGLQLASSEALAPVEEEQAIRNRHRKEALGKLVMARGANKPRASAVLVATSCVAHGPSGTRRWTRAEGDAGSACTRVKPEPR